ncbi:MAG: hypothetical protein F4103_08490 [Boseongicola sp. SB0673_bin_14]|nr:hypothetical protein [Boseongicola sp. SB0667_bin_21]MYI68760.1 hypothetical protein [Boseongicola sp. SB0673_bin_14]
MNDIARNLAGAVGLALVMSASPAAADILGILRSGDGSPDTSVAELVARTDELRRLAEHDPDLARLFALRLLEMMSGEGVAPAHGGDSGAGADAGLLRRSSPEAVLDLIELMEKAARARGTVPGGGHGGHGGHD